MKLSGHTKPYAVLGHPIGHSLSPAMHNAAFRALGLDAVYLAFDVEPGKLLRVLPAMEAMGFGGVNLTVPLKEVAFRGLTELDDSARRLGAVNTVQFLPDGGMRGHNTDGKGFVLAFAEAFDAGVAGRRVLMLGAGGAGRAVAIACVGEGAESVAVTDLDGARADRVVEEIARLAPCSKARAVPPSPDAWRRAVAEADVVIQATPVGMKPDDQPLLDATAFRPGQMLYDLVYMYPTTGIMRAAMEAGARAANGLGMLLHQGAWAFTIWTGKPAAVEAMRGALETAVYGRQLA
jgi:shikimate dehydrogenase